MEDSSQFQNVNGGADSRQSLRDSVQWNSLSSAFRANHQASRTWMYQKERRTIAGVERIPQLIAGPAARRKENTMTNYSASLANPNQALWEKGDFTKIAAFMRQSGESIAYS